MDIKDYMYPFMELLKTCYEKLDTPVKQDDKCYELILLMKKNEFFFEKSEKTNKFDKFVKIFMLDGWEQLKLTEYLKSSELTEKNIHIAQKYVEKATTFINNRSEKIIDKLEKILKNSKE